MIGTIVTELPSRRQPDIQPEDPSRTAFLNTLLNCREVVLRNGTANYLLCRKYIWCLQIAGAAQKRHLNIDRTVHVRRTASYTWNLHRSFLRIVSRNATFGLLQCHIYFIFCQQLARNNVQMLVTHTVKKRLAVLTVIDYLRSSDLPEPSSASA